MNTNKLKIYTLFILSLFIFYSCGSQKQAVSTEKSPYYNDTTDPKEQAKEHVINGATAEAKGDLTLAVNEYQQALELDKSSGIYFALAKNYYLLNKLALALQNAKKSVELSPESTEYNDLLADIYIAAHQNDSAAVILEKIIALDSSKISAYYQLALLYENNRPAQAIEIYQGILDAIGPEWNVLLRMAELNEKLGKMEDAAASIKELLSLDPSNSSLQKLLADFYIRTKMYDEAIVIIDDIIELTPDDLEAREKKAKIYLEQGDWKKASQEYSYIMDQPNIPLDVKVRIGGSYFTQSLQDSTLLPVAKQFFVKMDNDTIDWQVKMYLGAIAINEKDDSTAIRNFKMVTELAKWNADGWIRLGGLYFDNQKYTEAVKVMNEAIQSFPENFVINLLLGLSLAQSNKHSEAKPYLKKAIDLNPGDVTALSAYGFSLNQLKENDEAIVYLKKALEIKPDDVNLLGTLGLIYDSMEMWSECDSVYEYALKIDSSNALVNNNYAYSLSERGIQLERALEMSKIALTADPENSSYLDTMGWIYFKLGTYTTAKEYIEKAINAGGENAEVLEHMGDIHYMLGEKDQALDLWQKSIKLDSSNEKLKLKIEKGEI